MKLLFILLALKNLSSRNLRITRNIYGKRTKIIFTDQKTGATITVET